MKPDRLREFKSHVPALVGQHTYEYEIKEQKYQNRRSVILNRRRSILSEDLNNTNFSSDLDYDLHKVYCGKLKMVENRVNF